MIEDKAYVAKKLVNAGEGRSADIPLSKASSILTADLIRIKRMAYFADKFKAAAYDQGVDIAGKILHLVTRCVTWLMGLLSEVDVSDAFLIKLYKPTSVPLDENATDVDDNEDHARADPTEEVTGVYLVEPMRLTTTVVKFSGTLGSTTRSDLRSLTVIAFAHYVAQLTACRYVFADIQGE